MPDTTTPNLALTIIAVNDPAGEDLWGEKVNDNTTKIDTAVAARATTAYVDAADSGLATAIAGRAPAVHNHPISEIINLQAALDAKADDGDLAAYLLKSGGTITGDLIVAGAGGINVTVAGIQTTGGVIVGGDLVGQTPGPNENSTIVATTDWVRARIADAAGGGGTSPLQDFDAGKSYGPGELAFFQGEIIRSNKATGPGFVPTDWEIYQTDADLTTYAKLASPTFTGAPKAPTPTDTSNDTTLATTAFVKTALAGVPAPDVTKAYVDQQDALAYLKTGGAINGPTAAKRTNLGTVTGTVAPDFGVGDDFNMTVASAVTLGVPVNVLQDQSGAIEIVMNTGAALSFASVWDWESGTVPTPSTASGAVDVVAYWVRTANAGVPTSIVARYLKAVA